MVWQRTGVRPKELDDLLEIPEICEEAWKAFLDMHEQRQGNGFSINPLTYSEMKSYCDLTGVYLSPWEIILIKKFDRVAMDAFVKQAEKEKKLAKSKMK